MEQQSLESSFNCCDSFCPSRCVKGLKEKRRRRQHLKREIQQIEKDMKDATKKSEMFLQQTGPEMAKSFFAFYSVLKEPQQSFWFRSFANDHAQRLRDIDAAWKKPAVKRIIEKLAKLKVNNSADFLTFVESESEWKKLADVNQSIASMDQVPTALQELLMKLKLENLDALSKHLGSPNTSSTPDAVWPPKEEHGKIMQDFAGRSLVFNHPEVTGVGRHDGGWFLKEEETKVYGCFDKFPTFDQSTGKCNPSRPNPLEWVELFRKLDQQLNLSADEVSQMRNDLIEHQLASSSWAVSQFRQFKEQCETRLQEKENQLKEATSGLSMYLSDCKQEASTA